MSKTIKPIFLPNEASTIGLGEALGALLQDGGVIFLDGNLGAGKTTFCKGVLKSFGYSGLVKSPTYTLVEPYKLASQTVYHFDLYRLGHPEELEYMGIRDYFSERSLCLIEWFEKGEGILPQPDLTVNLKPKAAAREATIMSHSEFGHQVIEQLL